MTLLLLTRSGRRLDWEECRTGLGLAKARRLRLSGIEVAVVRHGRVVRARRLRW